MAVRRIEMGGRQVGIIDLEAVFLEVRSTGIKDPEPLKDLILEKVTVKNYIPTDLIPACRDDLFEEYLVFMGELPERRRTSSVVEIRLYGSSCFRCERLDAMVKDTLSRAGIKADYQYITDMRDIARAGIISTPALEVSGTIILMGQLPGEKDFEKMLLKAIDKAQTGKE